MFRWPRLLTKLPFPNKPFPRAPKAYLSFQTHQYFSICHYRSNQSIKTLSFSSQYMFHAVNQNGNIYKDAVSRLRILTKEQVPEYNQIVDKYISSHGTEQQLTKEESTAMLIILFEVGRYYQNKTATKESNEEEALKYYFEGLDLAKKTGLDKSWEAAFINNAVGTIYLFKGELSKAQEYLEKGNSVTAPATGSNTISHLSIQNLCMLSLLYERQGNLNKAIELLLDTQTKMNAVQADSVLPVTWIALYDHLGQRYYAKKDYKKAIDTWKKGQEIATKNLGENSYEARIFYKHLAAVLEEIQHFSEAFSYAYKYYKSNSAPFATNRDKLESLKAIGRLYIQQKKFSEALNALNKAQEVIKSSPGQFQDDSIQIYRTMAGLYFGQNKFAEAQTAFDSAEKIILSVYGEYSPKLIENYDFAAHLFRSMQESSETSIKYFHKALEFYKRFGDREKRNIISIYILLAETFVHRQNPEGAIKYMQEALRLCTSAPEAPEKLEQVYNFLAEAYSQQEKHEEAARNYAQAINICEANNNETEGMAYYCYHLGKTYEAMKSYVHAKNAYQRLLDYNVRTYGKDDMRTRESAEFVMSALYRLNQPEEVKKLQKEYGIKPKE